MSAICMQGWFHCRGEERPDALIGAGVARQQMSGRLWGGLPVEEGEREKEIDGERIVVVEIDEEWEWGNQMTYCRVKVQWKSCRCMSEQCLKTFISLIGLQQQCFTQTYAQKYMRLIFCFCDGWLIIALTRKNPRGGCKTLYPNDYIWKGKLICVWIHKNATFSFAISTFQTCKKSKVGKCSACVESYSV